LFSSQTYAYSLKTYSYISDTYTHRKPTFLFQIRQNSSTQSLTQPYLSVGVNLTQQKVSLDP